MPYSSILLRLVFAHILSDFFLQTDRIAHGKSAENPKRWLFLTLHSLTHAVVAYVLVAQWQMWYIPVTLFVTHFIIDAIKSSVGHDNPSLFLSDQAMHLVVMIVLWLSVTPESIGSIVQSAVQALPDNIWTLLITYALMLRPASILMSLLLKKWEKVSAISQSLPDGGKWIGYLERLLILTFIITDNIDGVGFLLAAKSVFRFGDLNKAKDIKTTEYVMIGTLTSFAIAITAGLLVK